MSDYKGKVVLLNFWATWCGPCKIEIPWFMDFEQNYKDKNFAVLGVSLDEDGWDAVKPYIAQKKINYRVVIGTEQVAQLYGEVDSLPTTFMIDREGRVAAVHVGLVSKSDYIHDIVQLLDAPDSGSRRLLLSSLCCFGQNKRPDASRAPEKVTAKIGAPAQVKLPLELRTGYHCNSNKPPDDYLVPLKLTWAAGPLKIPKSRIPRRRWKSTAFRRRRSRSTPATST